MSKLEVWGGIECTIARIGDTYRDQFAETGHHKRIEDLDLIADLGIKTVRYPVLWEAVSPDIVQDRGWDWHDQRLDRLRELGIEPIVGLLHHGSGPPDTHLLDPLFAGRLAEHARAVAERYPWIRRYTPINEPLTTARFSALYGHWYPHKRSYPEFLRALVNQCRATTLAMEAIRRVNPDAQLVQTEDIGRVFSTEDLSHQADHENERRWLSLDLLTGRVRPDHALWPFLLDSGIDQHELERFHEAQPPDLIGINHYLTSDRYLDSDLTRYPSVLHGGNGRQSYADVEAVRIGKLDGQTGPLARIREVAARYPIPLVVSEVHHGCTRDEQIRWLNEVWTAGSTARQEGIDVQAITVWSLFGASDWNSILTRRDGIYEPGVFDIRGCSPRPTALARATKELATTGALKHPALSTPAWWHRPERFYTGEPALPTIFPEHSQAIAIRAHPGPFLDEWVRIAHQRGLKMKVVARDEEPPSMERMPGAWSIIDTGDMCDDPAFLSWLKLAADRGLPYVYLSRSTVFDPRSGRAALESDATSPKDPAGRKRAAREAAVLARHPQALIIRAALLFGSGIKGFHAIGRRDGNRPVPDGRAGEFSYVPDLIHVALDLMIDGETGIRHLASGQPHAAIPAASHAVRLATERGNLMPPLESALLRSGVSEMQPLP